MEPEISMTERRYKVLRKNLDDMGYRQPLVIDSLPLVERIISDLLHTTESLRHYKLLAQQSLEECSQLGIGVEPYKHDNAELVQENNDLHLKLLYQKEESEKIQKELQARIRKLEGDNSDLQFISSQHLARVKSLEQESSEKTRKILQLHGKNSQANIITPGGNKKSLALRRSTLEIDSPLKPATSWHERFWSVNAQAQDSYIANMCDLSDQRIACLCREVNLLKEERVQQSDLNTTYRNQLNNRDREIQRLTAMLEGGRPATAVNNDCCYREMQLHLSTLDEDNKKLDKKNKEMERQVRDAVAKQHEAMNRAVKLVERNNQLEQEMRDIDHMALTVEAECNSTVKENTIRVSKIQDSLQDSLKQISSLEREVLELKRSNQEAQADFEKIRNEKQNVQKMLESSQEDKKKMTDRLNQFTIIENDLNVEIDRLNQVVSEQRRRIAELESRVINGSYGSGAGSISGSRNVSPTHSEVSRESRQRSKTTGGDLESVPKTLRSSSGRKKSPSVGARSKGEQESSPSRGRAKGGRKALSPKRGLAKGGRKVFSPNRGLAKGDNKGSSPNRGPAQSFAKDDRKGSSPNRGTAQSFAKGDRKGSSPNRGLAQSFAKDDRKGSSPNRARVQSVTKGERKGSSPIRGHELSFKGKRKESSPNRGRDESRTTGDRHGFSPKCTGCCPKCCVKGDHEDSARNRAPSLYYREHEPSRYHHACTGHSPNRERDSSLTKGEREESSVNRGREPNRGREAKGSSAYRGREEKVTVTGQYLLQSDPVDRSREASPDLRKLLEKERREFETRLKDITDYCNQYHRSVSSPSSPDDMKDDTKDLINRLQTERDYYSKEYHRLKEHLAELPKQEDNETCELRRKLMEKDRELADSKQTIRDMGREKHNLQVRRDSAAERSSSSSPTDCHGSGKILIVRLERERDLARGDMKRLEEERDALRERLKIATETQVSEHARYEKMVLECEERNRRLECERRDLMNSQGSQRATIHNAEDQLEDMRAVTRTAQSELSQQRIVYAQLKTLHEQTDRALADSQTQLNQSDAELQHSRERVRDLERSRAALEREVTQLKNERIVLKGNLAQVDQEKDGLLIQIDEKTEKAAYLDKELKAKEAQMSAMHNQVAEIQKKMEIILEENAAKEQQARNSEHEVQQLRQEICNAQRLHENSLREIRRLSDDLSASTQDVRTARCELEQSRREVENLKKQLQDYVAEVRRIEELLQQKEGERSELLDHFRSLSLEATALESNNNSLGHEAEEAKNHLHVAEHRVTDLQMKLEAAENLVRSYENQIADLSAHVACLESQMRDQCSQKSRLESDLSAVRDLCVKLDSQKDELIEASVESDVIKMHLDNELCQLREEQESLRDLLSKDRCTIQSLEDVLSVSRQETCEGRMANQELHSEVISLHKRIDDLQDRLDCETSEVRKYQVQAAEYSQQVSDLRREVTNEKFERARLNEECRRSSDPPACVCCRTVPRPAGTVHPEPGLSTYSRPGQSYGCHCTSANGPSSRLSSRPYTQPYNPPSSAYRKPTDYGSRRASNIQTPPAATSSFPKLTSSVPPGGHSSYIQPQPSSNSYVLGSRLQCTFTASGSPVTNATAKYTYRRSDGGTETTSSALTAVPASQVNGPNQSAPPSISGPSGATSQVSVTFRALESSSTSSPNGTIMSPNGLVMSPASTVLELPSTRDLT